MNLIDHIMSHIGIYLIILVGILIILLLILLKPKKVKPINYTVDEDNKEKSDIEKVIEALEDNKEQRVMTSFEEEQEANAIISYQELVKAVGDKKNIDENNDMESKTKEDDLSKLVEDLIESKDEKLEAIENYKLEETNESERNELENKEVEKHPKFKNSEFISPVFGKDTNNDKFLKELKDLRKNL